MTYLNRGQAYGIHFQDQATSKDTLITSTISITFHDITHRQAAHNYWRFWLSQQDRPEEARALDVDTQQSSGLTSVNYPSFDRITIQWQSHVGATLFIRFNCLSTDFSRIKGVKGIPLRVLVESTDSSPLNYDNLTPSSEKSFCKIKLFRDKGAERKNKDDAKQISKQLEKLKAEGNPQHNPLWHFYNQPVLPYSKFEALPEEDEVIKDDYSLTTPTTTPLSGSNVVSTIATAPATFALHQPLTSPLLSSPTIGTITTSPTIPSFVSINGLEQNYQQQQNVTSTFYPPEFTYPQQFVTPSTFVFNPMTSSPPTSGFSPSWSSSAISPVIGRKRSRSHMVVSTMNHLSSPPEDQPPMKRHQGSLPALTLFVGTKKSQTTPEELRRIELKTLSVQQLIIKLSGLFSLQAQSVTEVLWRRDPTNNLALIRQKKQTTPHSSPPSSSASSVLVLVEDCVLEHFNDRSVMYVQWDISSAGTVRFIVEF
ncbi:CP2 transcription factor-domain-containing protein [Chlamydoabsidia padenii]|nr:CP2 transcription factor-domain-containing protein [Chlamydoabsidia padenii]